MVKEKSSPVYLFSGNLSMMSLLYIKVQNKKTQNSGN